MSDASLPRPITLEIRRVNNDLRHGSPGMEIGIPDTPADDAHTKHEIACMTWLFMGKLISARLLDLPNLHDPASFG